MSEFHIHHLVSELLEKLGLVSNCIQQLKHFITLILTGGKGAEVYADILQKNTTPYVTTQVSAHTAKRKIADQCSSPSEFLRKYNDLKSRSIQEVDSLTFFLSKLIDEKSVVEYLKDHAAKTSSEDFQYPSVNSSLSSSTSEQLRTLQNQIAIATGGSSNYHSSEALRKILREKQAKKLAGTKVPDRPEWITERPYLTQDYVINVPESRITAASEQVSIGTLPLPLQELAILEDLLYLLKGVEGKYILVKQGRDRSGVRSFIIDKTLDPSLMELINRILPMCSYYSIICQFLEEKCFFEYGLVNQALTAAIHELMKEHLIVTAQLEHQIRQGNLSLQKMWFYLQPSMKTFEVVQSIILSINKGFLRGGNVLTLLHEVTKSHLIDSKIQELSFHLTQSAGQPFFEILEHWIYKGIIVDPYSEFFIIENTSLLKEGIAEDLHDAYWDHRYTIQPDRIPVFLSKLAEKILRTGKYLNVIRECGRDVQYPNAEEIVYTLDDRKYIDHIERAYNYASEELLKVLLKEKDLKGRLRSIRNYFLMNQGDFFVHFMDLAEDEMRKNIVLPRLDALLELALRTSAAVHDPYKDDLRIELLSYDLITQLFRILAVSQDTKRPTEQTVNISVLEAFTFDFTVHWPLSIIISRKALTRYQMLFRHLFYAKHVEKQLCSIWVSSKVAKQYQLRASKWYAAAFALRQRMLHFVQNYQYYMIFEVIAPNWHVLEEKLLLVSNIDELLEHHNDFLDRCLEECMLTNPELLKIVSKLMLVCVTFTNWMNRFSHSVEVDSRITEVTGQNLSRSMIGNAGKSIGGMQALEERRVTTKIVSEHIDQLIGSDEFERSIDNFSKNFLKQLIDLLDRVGELGVINYQQSIINIIARVDYNGFYTERLRMQAEIRAKAKADKKVANKLTRTKSTAEEIRESNLIKGISDFPSGSIDEELAASIISVPDISDADDDTR
ncbi:uncharacterized protein TRIADDRAFT_23299 [Trichoplax adhaerens]|uniref:Gamma-tubulin complex component n=1 Tax=Trichoplax adhaerens TaxID=10228 RepID=B3RRP8_TRIAD|nr:hypothetical protein TRIADDRAFT_23299 [Trichoplax adhaerens]EDV26389.1 hypothetical protein TRIADDRAFT_23299 [Trichoplax adhaerens]|eukprot:XP_002110385.1 hypothetical protein TRIADDRAFT_23299 [Trichoplax adhaerens]